jgi:hypothetical protein
VLGIGSGIALPLFYLAGRMFVEQFSDQVPIGPWAIVGTGVGALVVTALANAKHPMTLARLSPAMVLWTV